MRVVKVEKESGKDHWLLWMIGGAAVGITVGVLAAEKFSGRRPSTKGLFRRAGQLVGAARGQWGPLLAMGLELRDAFANRSALGARYEDDELDEEALYEEPENELDGDLDELELGDAELMQDHSGNGLDSVDAPLIGQRVLDAFENDPILAERNVEIDADDEKGLVTLYGSVQASSEVAHAVTLARGVPGVTKVKQKLEVVRRRR